MRTEGEQTRLPKGAKDTQATGFERDTERFDYVTVQNKIPGVPLNPRDVGYYKSIGFETVSTDENITGHEALTLMARPKDIGARLKAEQSARDNAIYGTSEQTDKEMLSPEGSLVKSKDAFTLGALGAELPTQMELSAQEAAAVS